MRQAGLVGCHRRRPVHVRTTRRDPAATPASDLVQPSFAAPAPDQLWIADITYLPTEQEGFLYLAVILDVCSRRVVGWSRQDHLRTELVVAALEMAVSKRRPEPGLIHPSDHGCQSTSVLFGERCAAAGIRSSMGTVGDSSENKPSSGNVARPLLLKTSAHEECGEEATCLGGGFRQVDLVA
jgi:putative transposase